MTKEYPTLFKKTATGAIQTWQVLVTDDAYRTKYGQEGGTITVSEATVCKGKQGRSDEEQALFEAEALHTKKLKSGYVLTRDAALGGEVSALITGGRAPMLAQKFSEHGDKLSYPAHAQPKLDGLRCIAVMDNDGVCTLWSRTRKPILSMPHIVAAIESMFAPGDVVDGELYSHSHHDKFEELVHFIRQSKPAPGGEVVEYHIYDAIMGGNFAARSEWLAEKIGPKGAGPLVLVETREVANEDELMLAFEEFLAQKYEGAIARASDGAYEEGKRSYGLLKIKSFLDSEYKCVAVREGVGKMKGHAIFTCVTENGTEFRAKMKGDHAALAQYVEHPELVVGKQVTVAYQGLTNKNKVPRFPVALRIRED